MNREIRKASEKNEDFELIKAFLSSKKEAFDKLVLKYQDLVFNVCFRFFGNHDEADDCSQETFIKVYKSMKNFKFQSSFSTWLYRIAMNTCKNRLASLEYRFSKKMIRLDKNPDEEGKTIDVQDDTYSPITIVERQEKEKMIQQAINKLPSDQKQVIVLRDIENLSYEEIVKITDLKLGTVKSKLARARESLRDKLKGVI
ncbi:MAG: sigma-70 family RNA polymerase sigma factor [Spirochaetes bacterium]|nr:sigma-70 family RNA polymerase sigma factor [Spirochaetota bacterium]